MKRIEIGTSYSAEFETQAELDAWKAAQKAKGRWADADITFEGDKPDHWLECRKEEYSKIDDLLKEALVERELGDNTKWDAYVLLRNQIKLDHPKP